MDSAYHFRLPQDSPSNPVASLSSVPLSKPGRQSYIQNLFGFPISSHTNTHKRPIVRKCYVRLTPLNISDYQSGAGPAFTLKCKQRGYPRIFTCNAKNCRTCRFLNCNSYIMSSVSGVKFPIRSDSDLT